MALGSALASMVLLAFPGRGAGPAADALIGEARAALGRGDGIDGEMKLRAALEQGAPRDAVAAWMGEAFLLQDKPERAAIWLRGGEFSQDSAFAGWRAQARLRRLEGNLAGAGRAYDRALAIVPGDASLWVEIGRLRYAGGEHVKAIEAADHALQLDPANVRALEFKAQLVRDRYGLMAALPWFESALMRDPGDVAVLLDYAATLGELGNSREAVTITRRVLELSPKNARAYYLQAVIAARAGDYALSRKLLVRAKGNIAELPGVLLLQGILELQAGNPSAAAESLEAVLRAKPGSRRAKDLLARAVYQGGEYRYLTLRFADDIARGDASPYLLTMVARAYENLGDRERAGVLLDRAAQASRAPLRIVATGSAAGKLLAQGDAAGAEALTETAQHRDSGFYDNLALAGDVQLALGHAAAAQAHYARAAEIRMPPGLFLRRYHAYAMARDFTGAAQLVEGYLRQNPSSRVALRSAAALAIETGDARRARAILIWLRDTGDARDVQLQSDLALVEAAEGNLPAAREAALAAYRLQRSSPVATQALAFSYAAGPDRPELARSLLDKARAMVGDTPLIAQARAMLRGKSDG